MNGKLVRIFKEVVVTYFKVMLILFWGCYTMWLWATFQNNVLSGEHLHG
jgi:hypothetical protein